MIKTLGFVLLTLFRLIVAHVLLLPALLVSSLAILLITFDFEDMVEFSNETDLTYLLRGKGFKGSYKLIKEALK